MKKTSKPAISENFKNITLSLSSDPNQIINQVQAKLEGARSYKSLSLEAKLGLNELLTHTLKFWCTSLLGEDGISKESRETFTRLGQLLARQGAPLQLLTHALDTTTKGVWEIYVKNLNQNKKTEKELIFDISAYTFHYFDEVSGEAIRSYLKEQTRDMRWRKHLHQQLSYVLLHSPQDEACFSETLIALGLDPCISRVAMALDVDLSTEDPFLHEKLIDQISPLVSRTFKVERAELIHAWNRERLIFWLPCSQGETISHSDQRTARGAGVLLTLAPEVRCIGLGIMNYGAQGWATSADEAIRALDFFCNESADRIVKRYSSILIEDSIRNSKNVLRYLVSLLQQLANEPELLLTLETYLSHGRRRGHTAKRLGIHPNTLDYRLGRVEQLLGASLDDTTWSGKLDIALKLRKYSLDKLVKTN
ncbi:PucR family transcriptional regulator [Pseudomonas aeruginosa]